MPNFDINNKIVKVLDIFMNINKFIGETYKARAYQAAAYTISTIGEPITSVDQVKELHGIGKSITAKIQAIIDNKPIEELDKLLDDKRLRAYIILSDVHGISSQNAKRLIKKGIMNIDDLRKAYDEGKVKLTHSQEIGLKYFEDFNKKIPRSHITKFDKILKNYAQKNDINIEIVGSYRRKKKESGDIDVLMSTKNNSKKNATKILNNLIKYLKDQGIIIDSLTSDKEVVTKYMGVIKIPNDKVPRRLDIRSVIIKEYPFALLYFTGSKVHNIKMRLHAKKMGYKLSEYSLIDIKNFKRINATSEKEIFAKLGMKYVLPKNR